MQAMWGLAMGGLFMLGEWKYVVTNELGVMEFGCFFTLSAFMFTL